MITNINNIIDNYKVYTYKIQNSNELSNINIKVKEIYIINLKKNIIRRKYICSLMEKMGINFTLVIVDKISDQINNELNKFNIITKSELGCLLSHLWCLNNIIKNKNKNAIIFEDDIIFHKNFMTLFNNIYSNNYDFLLLGACDFNFSSIHKYNILNNLYTITNQSTKVYGAHANYYSLNGATKMFNLHINLFKENGKVCFFDKFNKKMLEYFKGTSFICYPNLVVSDISTSNLHHKYSFFSIQEQNYYQKCFINFSFNEYHFIYLNLLEKRYKIEKKDTYESYINRILYYNFLNNDCINNIKKRLDFDFFTIKDLQYIMDI
jgi:GR25 family glycosyltransferase involved in LPS biosynthesis